MKTTRAVAARTESDITLSLEQEPLYRTPHGAAFVGDSQQLLSRLPDASVNLVFTSPPYALHFKKAYGNAHKRDYVKWFIPFAKQIFRVLTNDGSFVLNIGGSYNQGTPTRSLYHFHLLIALVEEVGFHLAQECFWHNPAKMPMPAEWVTVRRIRIKESVEYVWWFSKTPWPKASNTRVLKQYSPDMIRLNRRGVKPTVRPSGHVIRSSFDKVGGGAIPISEVTNLGFFDCPFCRKHGVDHCKCGTWLCQGAAHQTPEGKRNYCPSCGPGLFTLPITEVGIYSEPPMQRAATAQQRISRLALPVAKSLGRRWK